MKDAIVSLGINLCTRKFLEAMNPVNGPQLYMAAFLIQDKESTKIIGTDLF